MWGDRPSIRQLIDYHQFCGVPQQTAAASVTGGLDPVEVKAKLDRGEPFTLIDVREPHEYRICSIPGARLIPLCELAKRLNEFDPAEQIVAHCKSGVRSAKAVDLLRKAGFRDAKNMKGGILAWSDKVDPRVPKC